MNDDLPKSKWQRTLSGGKTALKLGGKTFKYLARKPFTTGERRGAEKQAFEKQSAEIFFQGLSLLKGTALKLGQLLSLELDILPETVRLELEKSYNHVAPMNRSLVRKIIINSLGKAPEEVFKSFEPTAFAAASLGQVHRAVARSGEPLAVKIQYPGIKSTIQNDIQIAKAILRPLSEYDHILPVLREIELRLLEETDYEQEAANTLFFKKHLKLEKVRVPDVMSEISGPATLCLSYLKGVPLHDWLKQNPPQEERDRVAVRLHEIFLHGLYELNCIHADPHPGNYLVGEDLNIGLVDFGCVKHFDPEFVRLYRCIPQTAMKGSKNDHLELLRAFHVGGSESTPEILEKIADMTYETGQWFSRLYETEYFDFDANPDFVHEGKRMMHKVFKLREHIKDVNTDFIYLNRTRYGLVRLFESMRVRVRIQNPYEWEGDVK